MKRIQKFAAVNLIAVLMGAGIPAMAAQHSSGNYGHAQVRSQRNDQRNRDRNRDRNNDRNNDWRDHGRGYAYAPPPVVYAPAPVYRGSVYDNGYYNQPTHNGRTAAIIGGSAAAGAVIGAAVGHGQGAIIGAVIGGIAGTVANAAADHHDRY